MGTLHRLMDHPVTRIAGPLLGLVCAGVFLAGIDAQEVGAAIHGVAWWWLVPVLVFGCVNLWLRAARWGVLLATDVPLPTPLLLGVGVSAGLAGLGLPARGGDAVKILLASRLPGVKLADVAAAELLERLVDGAIFGLFIAGAALLGGVAGWPLTLGLGALALYVPILVAIPLAGWYLGASVTARAAGERVWWHPVRILSVATVAVERRGYRLIAWAALLSLAAWAAEAVSYYLLLVAFGWLAPPVLPFAAVGVANFAFAVPGAPAGVGTFQMPVSSLLADHFGAEPSLAAAYAVVLHLAVLAPVPLVWLMLAARSRWLAVMAPAPVRIS